MMEKRNISIAAKNGYSLLKVKLAKQYLDEIGSNKRNFDFKRLVEMYNDIYNTHESAQGCKCQSPKYYNGIQNFFNYGRLTLINNGLATEADFENVKEEEEKPIENAENRIKLANNSGFTSVEEYEAEVKAIEEEMKDVKKSVGRPKKAKE